MNTDKRLQNLIVAFLLHNHIENVNDLTSDQRETLMTEFYKQPETIQLLAEIGQESSDFQGSDSEPVFSEDTEAYSDFFLPALYIAKKLYKSGIVKNTISKLTPRFIKHGIQKVAPKIGKAFGVKPPRLPGKPRIGGPVYGSKKEEQEKSTGKEKAEKEKEKEKEKEIKAAEKSKKNKMFLFGGIGAVLVIGIVLFIVFKK